VTTATSSSGIVARLSTTVGSLAIEVELDTGPGTLVTVGPNGAGKSTLLSLLLGARPVTRGRIEVGGRVLLDRERGVDVPIERRRLGYVPQDSGLFPHLDVRGNVAFAREHARPDEARAEREAATARMLDDLGVASLATRRPSSLSGGERQRVALARALVAEPAALLLDEPFAALDALARSEVRQALVLTLAKRQLPAIVVTHDAHDVRALSDRVVVMEAGRVVQSGSWRELSAAPRTAFVRALATE
jgi:molybdate transport system ATP-binding protein